jgi:hypothetical protein
MKPRSCATRNCIKQHSDQGKEKGNHEKKPRMFLAKVSALDGARGAMLPPFFMLLLLVPSIVVETRL